MAAITLPTAQPQQAFGAAKSIEDQWRELYNSCRCTQEAALAADCRINQKMTPEQTRAWLAANFTYKEIMLTTEAMRTASVRNRLERIKRIQTNNGMTPPWADEVYKEAAELGITIKEN